MEVVSSKAFRENLLEYFRCASGGEQIQIHAGNQKFVLISFEEYQELTFDETEYLLSSDANRKHLEMSLEEANAGKLTQIDLKGLWK